MSIYETTQRALAAAKARGGKDQLNCIAELDPTALQQAKALDEACSGRKCDLWGVPVLVKDNIDVKGLHTTAGSLALADNIACEDAPIVKNLRRNGAVVIGKTNMTEFANYTTEGMPGGYSSRGGQVIHAIDPSLSPAGSSSGSGVAVSAGIVEAAVGTDTSFSVIVCAQQNGICGLKPPVGTLSGEGIIPIAKTLDSAGPMAKDFSTALRLYSAMRDTPFPAIDPTAAEDLKIAVNTANSGMVSEEQRGFLDGLIGRLRKNGAMIEEIEQGPTMLMRAVMQYEFKPHLEEYLSTSSASRKTLREIVEYYEANPETMMKYGNVLLRRALDETPGGLQGREYLHAMAQRAEMQRETGREMQKYDAVILTGPTNIMHFCGMPSATVAAKVKNSHGVPYAVILYGTDETRLYSAALTIEKLLAE